MRAATVLSAMVVALPVVMVAKQPIQVAALRFDVPATIAEIPADTLKGQPSRLAWSADSEQLYLQMRDGNFGQPGAQLHHYVFNAANGRRQSLPSEPAWASAYWTTKSSQAAPDGAPAMKIELKSDVRTEQTTSVPMGGDLARGGGSASVGTAAGDGVAAAYNRQSVPVHSMFLKGELIGEFINSVIVPGLTFGWGPPGSNVLAFVAGKGGRVVVMDDTGTRKDVGGTKDAVLPAWSPDATRLAWLRKDGRKKLILQVAHVSPQ